MFHKVLVPLDGSAFAEQALPLAISIARPANASLDLVRAHVLYAFENPACSWAPFNPASEVEQRQHEQDYRSQVARAIFEAQAQSCGLIALTTHGRGGVKRLLLGSLADKVIRGASCPVLQCTVGADLNRQAEEPCHARECLPVSKWSS